MIGSLLSFGTFAVGFFARPLGGVVFGHMGDRIGRKAMLVASLDHGRRHHARSASCRPTPRSALGTDLLLVLRLAQGFGVGGEWGGAVLMAS